MTIKIDQTRAIELVQELMPIVGPSCQEKAVSEYVENYLVREGIPQEWISRDKAHTKTPQRGETGNLIVKLPGKRKGPRVLLSAHLDTVPICVGCEPVRKGDKIVSARKNTGLGADNRAGAAVLIVAALEAIAHADPYLPLTLCFFVQEEIGLQGSRCLQPSILGKPKLAFNFDGGTAAKLTIGATSGVRLTFQLHGLASHAGIAPQAGANALTAASLAIADLHRKGWLGAVRKGKRKGTSNIGVVQGGAATNVVAESALVRAEARSHDVTLRDEIVAAMFEAFEKGAAAVKSDSGVAVRVEAEKRVDYEAFKLDEESPVVLAAQRACKAVGQDPTLAISDGGLDANWLYQHGIPSVSLGCGQRDVHTTRETLDIPEYLAACRIATELALFADRT